MMPKLLHGYKKIPVSRGSTRIGEAVLFLYTSRGGIRRWIHGIVTEISPNGREACCWGQYLDKKKIGVPGEGRNSGKRVHWASMIARKTSGQQYMDFRKLKKKEKIPVNVYGTSPLEMLLGVQGQPRTPVRRGATTGAAISAEGTTTFAGTTGDVRHAIGIDWTNLVHATPAPRGVPPLVGVMREAEARVPGLPMPLIGDEDEDDEE